MLACPFVGSLLNEMQGKGRSAMNPIILTMLSAPTLFAIVIIILASKLVRGENAEQIAKGNPTKSRDELRRKIRIIRIIMSAIILICATAGVILTIVL